MMEPLDDDDYVIGLKDEYWTLVEFTCYSLGFLPDFDCYGVSVLPEGRKVKDRHQVLMNIAQINHDLLSKQPFDDYVKDQLGGVLSSDSIPENNRNFHLEIIKSEYDKLDPIGKPIEWIQLAVDNDISLPQFLHRQVAKRRTHTDPRRLDALLKIIGLLIRISTAEDDELRKVTGLRVIRRKYKGSPNISLITKAIEGYGGPNFGLSSEILNDAISHIGKTDTSGER